VTRAEVYAPGSIGNVGPGLDVLGLAVTGAGDTVIAERSDRPGVRVADPGHRDLSSDPALHASAIAARAVLRRAGAEGDVGLTLTVRKGLPLCGGQGGSAASAAAGAGAANAILGGPLPPWLVVDAALESETALAGRHADNVAPAVLGGLVLIRSLEPLELVRVATPPALRLVLVKPAMALSTREGRVALPATVPLATALHQAAQVAAMVAAAMSGDIAAFGRAIDDRIAEPARAPLLPGFAEAKRAAIEAGAHGCSISGSGPTAFAVCDGEPSALRVVEAMIDAYRGRGLDATARIAEVDMTGLRVTTS